MCSSDLCVSYILSCMAGQQKKIPRRSFDNIVPNVKSLLLRMAFYYVVLCRAVIPSKFQHEVLSELYLNHPGMVRMKDCKFG